MLRSDLILTFFILMAQLPGSASELHQGGPKAAPTGQAAPHSWQTQARLGRALGRTTAGTLRLDAQGVVFASRQAPSLRWRFGEIHSLDISAHQLVLTSYENRRHHQPGDRRYRFRLESELPAPLAAEVAGWLGKPSRNADPEPRAAAFAAIPAKHQRPFGGSNGDLRFRETGIDFITDAVGEARAWRWADIQTVANPDPYHFRVGGYRETYEFELKQPMSARLFDQLWDSVYGKDLNLPNGHAEAAHDR